MFSIELKYAVQIVAELERARLAGERVTTTGVRRRCGYEIMTFNNVMFYLNRSGWVDNGDYPALLVDLESKSLFDLAEAINDPAVSEHDYMYGWSSDSLRGETAAVEISRQLSEEYRNRLIGIPLAGLIGDSVDKVKNVERKIKRTRNLRKIYLKQESGT